MNIEHVVLALAGIALVAFAISMRGDKKKDAPAPVHPQEPGPPTDVEQPVQERIDMSAILQLIMGSGGGGAAWGLESACAFIPYGIGYRADGRFVIGGLNGSRVGLIDFSTSGESGGIVVQSNSTRFSADVGNNIGNLVTPCETPAGSTVLVSLDTTLGCLNVAKLDATSNLDWSISYPGVWAIGKAYVEADGDIFIPVRDGGSVPGILKLDYTGAVVFSKKAVITPVSAPPDLAVSDASVYVANDGSIHLVCGLNSVSSNGQGAMLCKWTAAGVPVGFITRKAQGQWSTVVRSAFYKGGDYIYTAGQTYDGLGYIMKFDTSLGFHGSAQVTPPLDQMLQGEWLEASPVDGTPYYASEFYSDKTVHVHRVAPLLTSELRQKLALANGFENQDAMNVTVKILPDGGHLLVSGRTKYYAGVWTDLCYVAFLPTIFPAVRDMNHIHWEPATAQSVTTLLGEWVNITVDQTTSYTITPQAVAFPLTTDTPTWTRTVG